MLPVQRAEVGRADVDADRGLARPADFGHDQLHRILRRTLPSCGQETDQSDEAVLSETLHAAPDVEGPALPVHFEGAARPVAGGGLDELERQHTWDDGLGGAGVRLRRGAAPDEQRRPPLDAHDADRDSPALLVAAVDRPRAERDAAALDTQPEDVGEGIL